MRRQVAAIVTVALVAGGLALAAPASAQTPPSDTESWGDLIGGGAEVGVFQRSQQPGGQGGGGGGGSNSNIVCKYTINKGGELPFSVALATSMYNAGGNTPVAVDYVCMDGATVVRAGTIQWTPAQGNPIDPAALAQMAKDRLTVPAPAGDMSPKLGVGTQAQMATYFWLDNWGVRPSATASAGGVTVTAVATPVEHSWLIRDPLRKNVTVSCGDSPGAAFSGNGAPPATACSWTPEHSSAGQPNRSDKGEPCFAATVRVVWHVTWDQGDLGNITTLANTCIVVHEIQAVVSNP